MSNPIPSLAVQDCPSSTAVGESSSHALFQDIVEYQNLPGVSSPKGLNSNTEVQNPPTQTQSHDDLDHQNNYESNMPPASVIRQNASRELNNLRSVNPPGRLELAPLHSTRNRRPTLQKAKTIYEEAVRATQRELAEFEAQKYFFIALEDLPSTDIRPRYRTLRMREQALLLASEDLCPLLEKSGLMQDARKIREEVDFLLSPITNIKLTYKDLVINVWLSPSRC